MIRSVLDVNVLVSALISPTGTPARILDAWRDELFVVVTNEEILAEFQRVVAEPRLSRRYGLTPSRVARLMRGLRQFAVITAGEVEVHGVAPDADDDKFLACAVEGGADYLVTGDHGLLALGAYEGVQVVSPTAFVQIVGSV